MQSAFSKKLAGNASKSPLRKPVAVGDQMGVHLRLTDVSSNRAEMCRRPRWLARSLRSHDVMFSPIGKSSKRFLSVIECSFYVGSGSNNGEPSWLPRTPDV